MPNIFAFGLLDHQKIFKTLPLFVPILWAGPFMTPGVLFAPNLIFMSQGCLIPNINALGPLVCERNIF